MKFLLAAAALMVGVSAKPGTIRKIHGAQATPKLMAKAMKYDDFIAKNGQKKAAGRKLEGEQEEFQVSSYHTINPQECVNFKVQTDNIYEEGVISYAANDEAVAEKSYVIFQVVSSANAYYADGNGDADISWIAPLGDFMQAMVQYKSAQRESYCEQCQKSQDYCYPEEDEAEEEEQQDEQDEQEGEEENDEEGEEENDEGRKLKAFERKLAGNYVNCNTCDSLNCWEAEEEEGQDEQEQNDQYMDDDELAEYVANFAECADTGIFTADGIELKAGFICGSRDGKNGGTGTYGPEIGLFFDEDCTVYYKSMDYYKAAAGGYGYYNANQQEDGEGRKLDDQQVYLTSDQLYTITDYIVDPYKNGVSCEAFPEFDEYNEDGEEEEQQEEEEANYEANEICQQIMEAEAVPLATCGYDDEEEQEEAEEEAEDEWEGNDYNFLYEYELSENDVEDIQAVCTFYNTYDFEGYQGNVYEGEVHYKPEKSSFASMGDMSAGAKFGIAVLVLAIVGGIAFVALKKKKAADDYKLEPLHDSKGTSA